ncbi:MAG: hypothetical protein FJZ11_00080 [Candidatus Omnitrophica bacterium]|nr:hypothetical protein [Candidatus Omnitrophota bacterium]
MASTLRSLILFFLFNLFIYLVLFIPLKQYRRRLYVIIIICYLLHLLLMVAMQFDFNRYPYRLKLTSFFFNDGELYELHARPISAILTNKPLGYTSRLDVATDWVSEWTWRGLVPPADTYQVGYITYFYGILYSIFGYSELIIHLWNIVLHLLVGILIFQISRTLFDDKTGYISTILFLFNPTLFYYATTKVAESSYIFLLCLIIFILLSISKTRHNAVINFLKLIILIGALFAFYLLKEKLIFPLLISILTYMIIAPVIYYKKLKWFLFFMLFFCVFYFQKLLLFFNYLFHSLSTSHYNYLISGGQIYNLFKFESDFNNYTFIHKLLYILFSWAHFIIEPARYTTILYVLYYPYKLIFIALSIFAFLGMVISIKSRNLPSLLLIFYLFLMGTVIAGASGNAGTMLRHRDMVSFVIFIFAAFFIKNKISGSFTKNQASSRIK